MKFEQKNIAGWSYFSIPILEEKGIVHGFFTGLSPSHLVKGDERQRFLDAFSLKDLVIMDQEHGDRVHIVQNGERPLSGDGIIVMEKGVAGIIKTADCLPVILVDPDLPVAAVVHAGWRGTVQRIAGKAIQQMVASGAARKRIIALLGPAIGPCCYEIQEDVQDIFRKEGFSEEIVYSRKGSLFLDIKKANIEALKAEGIEEIYDIGLCTYCTGELFHSYRRGDRDKRQINFVSLR
ncbi:MAG: peptidoglycan editing factor PgeF [Syntrophus sp. (in: bacteria)]|nr:peptidoglycan editing factor PgeF [Syntrophus sp. (in: bacteria)]